MSLKLWLPFTKDLLNYGTASSNITATNVTANTNGKLGGCYSFNGSSYLIGTHNFMDNNIGDWSFACWMKLNAVTAGQTLFSCRSNTSANGITVFYYGSKWLLDDGVRWEFTPTNTIAKNIWYHVCVVRKKGVGKYLYINGVLDSSTTTTGTPTQINTTNYAIGGSQNSSTSVNANYLNGYLNDARFYDHALSMVEIKELAKGLVLHYKLDDFDAADNLIINGNGELGGENWLYTTSDYISTTQIPPNHSEIKASFYHSNMTRVKVPIAQNHSYTISGYFKALTGMTGTVYPSIYPYDHDFNFIAYYMSAQGFDPNTLTTLSQPLHTGDTVIHATNLSNWRIDTTSYYYFAAIFGYKNSDGYVYEDLVYTRDTPQFGTQTDKSNINKTNNTITLRAPYTGADRPAGTSICQSTAGSTNYYPWGGINCSTISDWTFKTFTFTPANEPRLTAAEYIRWCNYINIGATNDYYGAGIKLTDNFLNNDMVIDSSGYGNHGTKNGNISLSYNTGKFCDLNFINTSSARYDVTTVFDGSTSYIDINSPIFPIILNSNFTISMWIYNNDEGGRSVLFGNYGLTGSYFNIEKKDNETVRFYWNGNPDKTFSNSILTANTFVHLVITRDGNTVKSYVNGVLKDTSTTTLSGTIPTTATNFRIGADSRTGATMFKGKISDVRMYASTLTDDDVLALYNVGARIADTGTMMGRELKEV